MKQKWFCFCLIILYFTNDCSGDVEIEQNLTLEMVQVVFRHGARTPMLVEAMHIGFNDSTLYEPEGYGQLTKTGKLQLYDLGRILRERYNEFLGAYKYQNVYAQSSDYIRAKMSLQLLLSGLFATPGEQTWNHKLNWIPIPFRYIKKELDTTFMTPDLPKFAEILEEELQNSVEFQRELSDRAKFVRYMEEKTGFSFKTKLTYHAGWTYYALTAHKDMNLPLPSWYTDELLASLRNLFNLGLDSMSYTEKLKRLNGGIIKRFVEDIQQNRDATDKRKIYLYSGHDLTLAAFTRAHGITTLKSPDYGSAVIVEKYKDGDEVEYLKMLGWDTFEKNMNTLKIKDCEDICALDKYLRITKDVIPSDEDLELILDRK